MSNKNISNIAELSKEEVKDINGGAATAAVVIGIIAGGAAIIDYGNDFVKGAKKGAKKLEIKAGFNRIL